MLGELNMQFILNMGLSADYAELGLRLIREFDVNAKDPATTRVLLDHWKFATRSLFSSGRIVCMPGDDVGKTATLLALEQVDRLGVVLCGGRTLNFLDRSPTQALAEGLSVLKDVVEAAAGRIDADFRPDDLYSIRFAIPHQPIRGKFPV